MRKKIGTEIKKRDASLTTGLLFSNLPPDPVRAMQIVGADMLLPRVGTVSRELVDAVHAAGAEVVVWTVNDPAAIRHCVALGVDGIISDYPDRVEEAVGRVTTSRGRD